MIWLNHNTFQSITRSLIFDPMPLHEPVYDPRLMYDSTQRNFSQPHSQSQSFSQPQSRNFNQPLSHFQLPPQHKPQAYFPPQNQTQNQAQNVQHNPWDRPSIYNGEKDLRESSDPGKRSEGNLIIEHFLWKRNQDFLFNAKSLELKITLFHQRRN